MQSLDQNFLRIEDMATSAFNNAPVGHALTDFRDLADSLPQIIWIARADGSVDYCNKRALDYSGFSTAQALAVDWSDLIHPDDVSATVKAWSSAAAAGQPVHMEFRLRRFDGEYRWHMAQCEPLLTATGEVFRWVGSATDISDRKRSEQEREDLLTNLQARARREALLNQIASEVRQATDPYAIQATIAQMLGEAIGADRCYFATYDLSNNTVTVSRDWHRPGLPSIEGDLVYPDLRQMFNDLYREKSLSVVDDSLTSSLSATTISNMSSLGLRSRISYALTDRMGMPIGTITAAMVNDAREWTEDEITLFESVTALTRSTMERARVQLRDHNIAEQLQEALQPPIPKVTPGLALSSYYEAAFAEASVGGDFYDVFPLDPHRLIVAVGDVSGKGLSAARQVSIARNMLRSVLYMQPEPASAVTALNGIVAHNDLLDGFATLFVGLYDNRTRLLSYANCGQEPALIWHAASGAVERCVPTGTILGPFPSEIYSESQVELSPGDIIAIFTDGFTEAGQSRAQMIGIDGVEELFIRSVNRYAAERTGRSPLELARLISDGITEYGGFGVSDDACLLIGVAE